jgi:hypothetical protein
MTDNREKSGRKRIFGSIEETEMPFFLYLAPSVLLCHSIYH